MKRGDQFEYRGELVTFVRVADDKLVGGDGAPIDDGEPDTAIVFSPTHGHIHIPLEATDG